MRPAEEAISQATRNSSAHLMIVDDDADRATEVASALSSLRLTAAHGGPAWAGAEALKRERPSLVIVNERTFAGPSATGGLRAASAEQGIPVLVVVDEIGEPHAMAEQLAMADDWIHRSALAREGPARVARILKRRSELASASTPSRTDRASSFPLDAQFFALVVHDLRTPLNVIGLSLRMISQAMPKGDPELDEDLRFVDENFRQIERMLAQLSDFYRLYEGESQLAATAFSTRRLVDELLEARAIKAGARASAVRLELDPTCPERVELDPLRARLAIQYVLSNTTGSSNGEPIRLMMRGSADRWVIEVAIDHPPPPSVKPVKLDSKSFERLCGFAAERRGMDLAIAARVSEMFGGSARLDVVENQGTTVVLDWPAGLVTA